MKQYSWEKNQTSLQADTPFKAEDKAISDQKKKMRSEKRVYSSLSYINCLIKDVNSPFHF